jgi:uncharacterized Zn-binding protein involved in type VI secretion|tara:strand:+ start:65 stop:376 length:312 start_codon:yes stop_codon:yes gene_type:complete
MPAVSRDIVDLAKTGHGCHTVIGVKATQRSVFANNKAILRPGDPCLPHTIPVCCPLRCDPHLAKVNMGSPTVFVKNVPVARSRDSTDMGALFMGSPNVFANGQ